MNDKTNMGKSGLPDAMINKKSTFHGNPLLKNPREKVALTKEHIIELKKCAEDPVYFAENYVYVVNVDSGKQIINLYPYQKRLLKALKDNQYRIILSCRQSGKCVKFFTKLTLKHPKYNNGEPFVMMIGQFYLWLKFREIAEMY